MVVLNKNHAAHQLDTRRFAEKLGPRSRGTEIFSGAELALGESLAQPPRSVLVLEVRE